MAQLPHSDYYMFEWMVVVDDGSGQKKLAAKIVLGGIMVSILVSILWWWNQSLKLGGNQLVWLMIPFVLSIVAVLDYFWIKMTSRVSGRIRKYAVSEEGLKAEQRKISWGEVDKTKLERLATEIAEKGEESSYYLKVEGVVGIQIELSAGGSVRLEMATDKVLRKVVKAMKHYVDELSS